jgi:hypothetical protein
LPGARRSSRTKSWRARKNGAGGKDFPPTAPKMKFCDEGRDRYFSKTFRLAAIRPMLFLGGAIPGGRNL